MANKTLTAKVRLDSSQAEKSIDRLNRKINALNRAVNTAKGSSLETQMKRGARAASKLNSEVQKTTAHTNAVSRSMSRVSNQMQEWANKQVLVNNSLRSTGSLLGTVKGKLRGLIDTYLGVMGLGAMINTSDMITSAQNKLNNVNATQLGASGTNADGTYSQATINATQEAMDKMYVSSQKVRMSYTDMMTNVAKSMTLAGDAFNGSTDNAIRFQEIMAEAYAVGGASAAEMSSSMYQLMQALGAGVLAGDELRSVREGAPLAYKAIEEFAQGVYNTEESLKELGSQGKITSDMVVAAIMNAGDQMDMAFAQTAQTFAQTWEQIKNAAKKAFEPVSKMLRESLNKAIDNGMIQKIETMFVAVSKALQILFQVINIGVQWIANNWSWLQYVVIGALILIATYMVITGAIAVASAIKACFAWAILHWELLSIVLAIAIVIYAFYLWKTAAIDTCTLIIMLLAAIAIAAFVLFGWQVALVIALLALIFTFFEEVCGGGMWLGATLLNIGIGFLNALMQAVYSMVVEPIAGIIEWFVNAFNGGFNGILGAAANAIGQIVSLFLGGLKVITKAVDAVADTSFSEKISGWQNSLKSWGKNENAISYKVEAPEIPRISATNAYEIGASWAADKKSKINEWGSKYQTGLDGFSLDNFGEMVGLDVGKTSIPSMNDPANALNTTPVEDLLGDVNDKLGGVKGDTGSIADSMELTEDDLKYLRELANMEWKKEYTTAHVAVHMNNKNTINNKGDLDNWVITLRDMLTEEIDAVANGVYA